MRKCDNKKMVKFENWWLKRIEKLKKGKNVKGKEIREEKNKIPRIWARETDSMREREKKEIWE